MSKRWHKFNFREWRSDEKLRRCDRDVQAIWLDLCGLIYDAEDMGRLSVEEDGARRPYTRSELCRITGDDPRVMNRALSQLIAHKVCEEEGGYLVSRRIAREELRAQQDASNGSKGGNPALKDKALAEKGVNPQKPDYQNTDIEEDEDRRANEFDELHAKCRKWANGSLNLTLPSAHVLDPIIRLMKPDSGPACSEADVERGITSTAAWLHSKRRQVKSLGYFEKAIIEARDERLRPNPEVSNETAGNSGSANASASLGRQSAAGHAPRGYRSQPGSQYRGGSIEDAAIRRQLLRQNGDGVPGGAERGRDVSPAGDIIDGEFKRVG